MPLSEILVLANSQKHGGRCIAGLDTADAAWVRPISDLEHGELYPVHYLIQDATPRLLDVVRFTHSGPAGDPAQPENVRIVDVSWESVRRLQANELYETVRPALVTGPQLLGSYSHYIEEDDAAAGMEASLALIEPSGLQFSLDHHDRKPSGSPRGRFFLDGSYYDLPLTDFIIRPRLLRAGYGTHSWEDLEMSIPGRTLLVISLGTPFNGRCYKLIAAVLPLPT